MTKLITIKLNNGEIYDFETSTDVNIEEALNQEIWSLSGYDGVIYIRTKHISVVKVIDKE